MTAQIHERLIYEGKECLMADEPLHPYLKEHKIEFSWPHTACWRGYTGSWLIENGRLYLIGLKAYIKSPSTNTSRGSIKEVGMDYLFPGQEKVFADWYSGEIRIPQGKLLEYIHLGFASVYEKDLFLMIEAGQVVGKREIDNTAPYKDPDQP